MAATPPRQRPRLQGVHSAPSESLRHRPPTAIAQTPVANSERARIRTTTPRREDRNRADAHTERFVGMMERLTTITETQSTSVAINTAINTATSDDARARVANIAVLREACKFCFQWALAVTVAATLLGTLWFYSGVGRGPGQVLPYARASGEGAAFVHEMEPFKWMDADKSGDLSYDELRDADARLELPYWRDGALTERCMSGLSAAAGRSTLKDHQAAEYVKCRKNSAPRQTRA